MTENLLRGRRALVTGASAGLGADFARELAARGCDPVLVARREEQLRAVQSELHTAHGVAAEIIPLDLTAEGAVESLYERIQGSGTQVDLLVNNAGYGLYGRFVEIPWERERNMLQLDIVVLTQLTKLFLPGMIARRFGYVLQVSSIGAYQPTPLYATYSAAKSYVLSFGEALNYELRGTGVHCTVVSPGVADTDFRRVAGQRTTPYQRMVMMDSRTVARIGVEAMLRGRSSVVPGRLNAVMAWSNRLVPRRLSTALAQRLMVVR